MVKRRDDWNNRIVNNTTMKHHRFELSQGENNGIPIENSYYDPLTLQYNDTPLTIAYDNEKTVKQQDFYTQQYDFYGFDLQFNPDVKNKSIATTFYDRYIKQENETSEEVPSLCFIGYGQSGSGKTSTLIYLDVEGSEQDGILIETLKKIVNVHFPEIKKTLLQSALNRFFEIRDVPGLKKKPSTSEALDWIKLLLIEDINPIDLKSNGKDLLPKLHGALLKNEQDIHLFERLAFMARGNR